MLRKNLVFVVIILLFGTCILPIVNGNFTFQSYDLNTNENVLDVQFIYNITKALSDIIFTEYDETAGEIAKGRAFGTKGEHKAAEILYENMTDLGLYTTKERIKNTDKHPNLTYELEIVDYFVKINNRTVDAYIAPVWFETSENNYSLNHTYSYNNLKVIKPPLIPWLYMQRLLKSGEIEPFVLILQDRSFYSNRIIYRTLPIFNYFIFQYCIVRKLQGGLPVIYSWKWDDYFDYCKGIILYDFNEDVHDMNILKDANRMPFVFINGSDGRQILNAIEDTRVAFKLTQHLNTSAVSYNVIGQLNGTDPSKTVIVDCLYDSWWCQGTADSAIGMAMVLAIAKYFKENNITPKYNIKFIGFGGEEHGFCAGSKYYESFHTNENILYVVDLNQLGFRQDNPKLTLNVIVNKLDFLKEIWRIIKKADYEHRVDSSDGIKPVWMGDGGPSNSQPFAKGRTNCRTVCFLKDGGWKLHHRDGLNHTEGDVLKYFDPEDVSVTGKIVLNVVKYLTTDW